MSGSVDGLCPSEKAYPGLCRARITSVPEQHASMSSKTSLLTDDVDRVNNGGSHCDTREIKRRSADSGQSRVALNNVQAPAIPPRPK